tara:strand:- start:1951 stop:3081 length:1131 start_codon:yes stop_codon:yes gene_type:complete
MKFSKYKLIAIQLLLLNQFLVIGTLKAEKNLNEGISDLPNVEYLENIHNFSDYILGPGDLLKITVTESSDALDGTYSINGEGIVSLKRIKRIYVEGLTVNELTNILNKKYSKYVKEPDVSIEISNYRSIRVYIDGEIENPGLYTLQGSNCNLSGTIECLNSQLYEEAEGLYSFPLLFDIIRKAGGVTLTSDLSNITISRINSISNGSGKIKTSLNLLEFFENGDESHNIRLLDGDRITIAKSPSPTLVQLSKAIKSNINPKEINVWLSGRVNSSGKITINKQSTLYDAIDMAGGTKIIKGPIRFIRYNSDGTTDKRQFAYRKNSKRGSFRNPYLKSGDIIMVSRNAFNVASEIISEVSSPFAGLLSTYGLLKALND